MVLRELFHLGAAGELEEIQEPALAEVVLQRLGVRQPGVGEAQLVADQREVVDLDVRVGDMHLVIGRGPPARARLRIEREDQDFRVERLLQAGRRPAGFLVVGFPAVLVVHVEHEIHRGAAPDEPREHHPDEERLAGAGLTEHAVRALDEALQVEAHRRVHLERGPDPHHRLARFPEHESHVFVGGLGDAREMRGDRLDRMHLPVRPLEHQLGLQLQRHVRLCPRERRPRQIPGRWGRLQHRRIRGFQLHVVHAGEETVPRSLHDDEAPDAQVLDIRIVRQPRHEPLEQRPLDDVRDRRPPEGPALAVAARHPILRTIDMARS